MALRILLLIFIALQSFAQSVAPAVAADVNGRLISTEDVDRAARKQIADIEEQLRRLRQAVLMKLIDNTLLEQSARAASVSVEEFLKAHVESVSVAESDVDEAYRRSAEQFGGVLAPEAKYRIRRSLEDNRRADALRTLLTKLRQEAKVTNYMLQGQLANVETADLASGIGPVDAPVRVVLFSDLECPYCRELHAPLSRVLARWPGQVRLIYRHFPLDIHANSFAGAKAAVCAGRQGKLWPFVDKALLQQGPLSGDAVRQIVSSLAINPKEFSSCVDAATTEEHVRGDIQAARTAGISGTPALYVNKRPVPGAGALERMIEDELRTSLRAAGR